MKRFLTILFSVFMASLSTFVFKLDYCFMSGKAFLIWALINFIPIAIFVIILNYFFPDKKRKE